MFKGALCDNLKQLTRMNDFSLATHEQPVDDLYKLFFSVYGTIRGLLYLDIAMMFN